MNIKIEYFQTSFLLTIPNISHLCEEVCIVCTKLTVCECVKNVQVALLCCVYENK